MKHIYRLLASAILLIITAACYNEEIETPQSPDQQQSDFRITASIIQTRVAYEYSDLGKVTQEWEEGDILFGFWGGSPSVDNQIVFRVSNVDDSGVATLEAVSGADWIEEATEGVTQVDLVYTGGEASFTDSGIDVDLSGQSLDRVPGCMHAQATLQVDEDGNKSLEFYFQNDCALIEIDSLTGFAENWPGGNDTSLALSVVSITNLLLGGSYSFSGETLVFESDPESLSPEYDFDLLTGWTVSKNGDVSGPDGEKILIAVAPNSTKEEISVCAANSTETGLIKYSSYSYGERSLAGGLCYVISAQPVVAKTADGECFKTVEDAFNHSKDLSESGYGTAAQNVVTLIKKEINGFGEQTSDDSQHMVGTYDIDYNVTLDLNGCTFILSGSEGFQVTCSFDLPTTFIITDSNGLNDEGDYEGCIKSTSNNPIIFNYGIVIIDGGNLLYSFDESGDYYVYCMINNEGGSLTINKDSFLQADGNIPDVDDDVNFYLIKNIYEGKLEVNGGYLYAWDDSIITIGNSDDGKVTVNGGEVYSAVGSAIESLDGELVITGGVIGNESKTLETLQVLGKTVCTISGGVIYNLGEQACAIGCRSTSDGNPVLTVMWPDPSESGPSVYEPLIYSGGKYQTTLPISAYMDGDNGANITIKGGFLISNNTFGAFYSDDESCKNLNLNTSGTDFNFGNFYSNMSKVIKTGTDPSGTTVDLSKEGGVGLPNENDQHYYASLQQVSGDSLISAIIFRILEVTGLEESEEIEKIEKTIDKLYMIHAVTNISD